MFGVNSNSNSYHVPLNLYRIKSKMITIKVFIGSPGKTTIWNSSNLNIEMQLFLLDLAQSIV